MNLPESLEQYLIQFLEDNRNKNYPDNYNDIVNAAQIIQDHYFPQQSDLDDKDSYIEELEGDMSVMQSNADDVIGDIKSDIDELERKIRKAINQMKIHCDNWCY